MGNNIEVCLACDNNYAKYAGIVISSILYNAKETSNLIFYILDGGISQSYKTEFEQLKNIKDCTINYIEINDNDFSEYKKVQTHKYITLATYYRLKLPQLLPEVKRVIYLDCDTIVNSDLEELYNLEMPTECFAGVHDIDYKTVKINPTYVNAGVLVMDLQNMRNQNLEEKFLNWTIEHQDTIKCGDQEIINEVCKGNIKVIDSKWNVQTSDFMNRSVYINKPNIIHYIAKNKPWNKISICYYKSYYLKYLQLTPWKLNYIDNFLYKYLYQTLSCIKFILHRPTFIFQKKFYHAFYKTYIKQ